MLHTLIVTAHPSQQSFNIALSQQAAITLTQSGAHVLTSDLYQMNFEPRLGINDHPALPTDVATGLMQQQTYADEHQLFSPDITLEQDKLRQADVLILQFPIWWGSYPAILKGWIERIFSYGFAYGSQKKLAGKKVMLSVTTGGAKDDAEHQYYLGKIAAMGDDIFNYIGMEILKPHVVHGPASINQSERQQALLDYERHLQAELDLT